MVSKGALLRNIRPSGGLFTENILLRLRDNPIQLKIGKIDSFLEEDTKEARKKFKGKKKIIFDWCIQKWDEISPNIEEWLIKDLAKKWLIPLFTLFDHDVEDFEINKENLDEKGILKEFRISYQSKDHKNPFFHFVSVNEDFDSKIDRNLQKKSHHDVCQQFINFNPEIKWLFLSNGRILRILSKYYHSYSKGYLEFDLENIFANRDEREFDTLYSIIHRSRFIPDYEDHKFLIDVFQKESVSEGVKIGDALRDNIHDAIELLGDELIQQNPQFQDKILANEIEIQEYYAELLRIIYRIIFILYAEQREMLPGVGTLYFEQFSLSSFRFLAEKPIKAEKNYDLWKKLFITFQMVNEGNEFLEVNSYNGSLFKNENLSLIFENKLKLSNSILLRVIRKLTTSKINNVLQRVNFLEVNEEEIGIIYESLLDYKPYIDSNSQFQLIEGTERKSTGSYYTPKELIDILIRTTLQPLVEDRLEKARDDLYDKIKAILDLKICDPACGGGTFLLSALDFLGKSLAEVKAGLDSPSEKDLRKARREVLQHCIYGVDMNPLAVELAKMSLWLRACVKNKPLNFLDNHIKCGNSLIGLGQKTEIEYISPEAFLAISGNKATGIPPENKKLQNMARERIRNQIKIQEKAKQELEKQKIVRITAFLVEKKTADICSAAFQEIIELPEDNPELIEIKEKKYQSLKKNPNYQQALTEANIWTSTYFWPFEGNALGSIPDNALIGQLRDNIYNEEIKNILKNIRVIVKENQFFHWYIEFPEVFSSERRGFDCILTNPPWETLQLKEMEFFAGLNNSILNAPNQAERRQRIKNLKTTNPKLYNEYKFAWMSIKKMSHYLTKSELFNLTAHGTLNTYALFVERCWKLIAPNGYTGVICPTGIITNYYMQDLFRNLVQNKSILSIFDFINNRGLFDIHRDYRFCLLTLGGKNILQEIIPMTFFTLDPMEIQEPLSLIFEDKLKLDERINNLQDDHILIPLEQEDFELFNPNTITCPSFRIKKDFELLKKIYKYSKVIIRRDIISNKIVENPWEISLKSMFHSSNDSSLFITQNKLVEKGFTPLNKEIIGGKWINNEKTIYHPLYEGRMIWHYNHRLNSIEFAEEGGKRKAISHETTEKQYKNENFLAIPMYWVNEAFIKKKFEDMKYNHNWVIVYRRITGSTNERTFISSLTPWAAFSDSLTLILSEINPKILCAFLANINSIIFDYVVRQKLSGTVINHYIFEQLPVLPPKRFNKELLSLILSYVLELSYISNDLKKFAEDLGYNREPFEWEPESRASLQAELDAIFAHLYKLNKNDLNYILDTFNVLKRKEIEEFNEFKTKRLVLDAFDKFSKQKELFE